MAVVLVHFTSDSVAYLSRLFELGAIAGAGIALGTVAALSKATPPKPPGAQ